MIRTRELTAWGCDAYEFRPAELMQQASGRTRHAVAEEPEPYTGTPICEAETALLEPEFSRQRTRADLRAEMEGLEWCLRVVNLRKLFAFQRRVSFPAGATRFAAVADDWPSLIALTFPPTRPVQCDIVHDIANNTLLFHSDNPNLQLRTSPCLTAPVTIHSTGPFFEVAQYRGRWFLRDGYHRAYSFLRAGIEKVPSVVVYARTLAELEAEQPWFFPEPVLFSPRAPRVTNFLDDDLTIEYDRPPTRKTIRITFEESIAIAPSGATT